MEIAVPTHSEEYLDLYIGIDWQLYNKLQMLAVDGDVESGEEK